MGSGMVIFWRVKFFETCFCSKLRVPFFSERGGVYAMWRRVLEDSKGGESM